MAVVRAGGNGGVLGVYVIRIMVVIPKMNFHDSLLACAVGSAVISAGYGMLCVIRSGRWNHPGHLFGVLAVFWLASLAWPHNEVQAPVVEQRPAVVSDAVIATLLRYEELRRSRP